MKLNGSMLVAVAMMVGSLSAMGCKAADKAMDAIAPEDNTADAPVTNEAANSLGFSVGFENDYSRPHYYARYAPPAARFEVQGRAPSERHFWAPGYYRWNGREHVWYNGRWEARRDGYAWVGPHWRQDGYGRWEFVRGYWRH